MLAIGALRLNISPGMQLNISPGMQALPHSSCGSGALSTSYTSLLEREPASSNSMSNIGWGWHYTFVSIGGKELRPVIA